MNYGIYDALQFLYIVGYYNRIIGVPDIVYWGSIELDSALDPLSSASLNIVSEYRLNKSADKMQPCQTSRLICISSDVDCSISTTAV